MAWPVSALNFSMVVSYSGVTPFHYSFFTWQQQQVCVMAAVGPHPRHRHDAARELPDLMPSLSARWSAGQP
jgi:hypothetical protein